CCRLDARDAREFRPIILGCFPVASRLFKVVTASEEGVMDRLTLLREISFGAQVAEEETAELANYFVETDQWVRILRGEVDVIRGYKGSGKSAIYSLLSAKSDDLFDKRILLITGEKPRGTPVFKELVTDPPASEAEFIGLWKLYIASLIAER